MFTKMLRSCSHMFTKLLLLQVSNPEVKTCEDATSICFWSHRCRSRPLPNSRVVSTKICPSEDCAAVPAFSAQKSGKEQHDIEPLRLTLIVNDEQGSWCFKRSIESPWGTTQHNHILCIGFSYIFQYLIFYV